jgi:hypothetical protein
MHMNGQQPTNPQDTLEERLKTDFKTLDEVESEVERGDLSRVPLMRQAFFDHRSKVMKAMTETGPKGPSEIEMIKAVIEELRVRERDFNDRIRAAEDREHAAAMAKLAEESNTIAGRLADAAAQTNNLTAAFSFGLR